MSFADSQKHAKPYKASRLLTHWEEELVLVQVAGERLASSLNASTHAWGSSAMHSVRAEEPRVLAQGLAQEREQHRRA